MKVRLRVEATVVVELPAVNDLHVGAAAKDIRELSQRTIHARLDTRTNHGADDFFPPLMQAEEVAVSVLAVSLDAKELVTP